MDENRKDRQRQRALRGIDKHLDHDELKRRKAAAARRRAERGQAHRPRARDWDAESETFEKIRRARPRSNARPTAAAPAADQQRAVVAALHHGRVELDDGRAARIAGHLFADPTFRLAVGDEVAFTETDGPARIEARIPRRTCLSRPDPGNPHRALVIAANIDVAAIVVAAADPPLRPGLIDRLLLALEHGGVGAAVCVNKIDLVRDARERDRLEQTLAPYHRLGCAVFCCSATAALGLEPLRRQLSGKTAVFVGHSGVGKSAILNALDPQGGRTTGAVRSRDGRGRHTTTWSSLRTLADGTRVIDTPGVRAFGLDDLDPAQVRAGFTEFARFAVACRYGDCTHVHEPQCAVRGAAESGALPAERYASYLRILAAPQ